MLTNIFVFVFGPEVDPEYIRIRIRVKKNIPNIFVFVFGPQKNIRYALFWLSNNYPNVITSLYFPIFPLIYIYGAFLFISSFGGDGRGGYGEL